GRDAKASRASSLQSLLAKQARHALAPDLAPFAAKRSMNPRAAVAPLRLRVDLENLLAELAIFQDPSALAALLARVEAASRRSQNPADSLLRVRVALGLNSVQPHRGRSEKIANAFFRMSRSSRRIDSSRRSCFISSSAGIDPGATTPWPAYVSRHSRSCFAETPRSPAAALRLPSFAASRTASWRPCAVYCYLRLATRPPPPYPGRFSVSTKAGQAQVRQSGRQPQAIRLAWSSRCDRPLDALDCHPDE